MSISKAKKHFLGQENHERLNCAEAILKAFEYDQPGHCQGSGLSPNNECGAYCAGQHIIGQSYPDKAGEFENFFLRQAGSLSCREIRKTRKLSCLGCVEKAAEFIEQLKHRQ